MTEPFRKSCLELPLGALPAEDDIDYTMLPTPPIGDGLRFRWLRREARIDAKYMESYGDKRPDSWWQVRIGNIEAQASAQGLELPAAYLALMKHQELRNRFRSPTADFFDIPDAGIVGIPDRSDERLLRFYMDSQGCWHWYIHWNKEGRSAIVGTPFNFCDGHDYEKYNQHAEADGQDEVNCAWDTLYEYEEDFEFFMFRLWVGQEHWWRKETYNRDSTPLQPLAATYVDAYRARRAALSPASR